ncbi:uncharacterized protein LOC119651503 isoform X2 [Hermetia illucens]|uniref:uncharacterized protein LOC119651503 isoform X2 n=1 Tax=Hermetia illucens TaxID=343691 RepID=UPI0018CC2F0E|nr:uncharacterized protein LOC119651503 isoform X2 [Hermetia illucens]
MPWISFLDMSPENSIRDNALLFDEALLVLGYCSMKPTGIFATFIQAGLTDRKIPIRHKKEKNKQHYTKTSRKVKNTRMSTTTDYIRCFSLQSPMANEMRFEDS